MGILSEHDLLYYSQLPNSIQIHEDILSFFIPNDNNVREHLPDNIINIRNANANTNGISSNYPSAISGHGENWPQSMDSRGNPVTSKAIIGTPQIISINKTVFSRDEAHQLIDQSENVIEQIINEKKTTKIKIAELRKTICEKKKMFAVLKLKHADALEFQKYQRLFISKEAKREHILDLENKQKIETQHHTNVINKIKTHIAESIDTRNKLYQQLTAARQEKIHIEHKLVELMKNEK
jgi:arsenate reductase-like glutaredoxin family protein